MLPIDTIFYDGDFDIEIFVNCKNIGSWEKLATLGDARFLIDFLRN